MRIDLKQLSSTLQHVALPPRTPGRSLPPLLVLLHGRGADEHDLIPITHYLDPRFFLISARAPLKFAYGGQTWFDINDQGTIDLGDFRKSYDDLAVFIDDARGHYPVAQGPVYLFGFSMGAMMALAYTLAAPNSVRAVAAHSGYLPTEVHVPYRWNDIGNIAIFQAHGTNDPVVSVDLARRSRDLLSRSPATYRFVEYPIQHQISEQSIADINQFYRDLLGPLSHGSSPGR
ncbi:MAG: alpha/beta fold hydrolase [Bacteroidetes bacterium]|nr:alpha/beta fold hydrolase [Bacteroidota bacterium]